MTAALRIALVEDHTDLRELLVEYLRGQSHDVVGFVCAEELDEHLAGHDVDILILDLNLPGEDGLSIARRLRAVHSHLYVVMLTARDTLGDCVEGYGSGADLYLTKPVPPAALAAAIGSMQRRLTSVSANTPTLVLDTRRLTLKGEKDEVAIGRSEALLLKSLAEAPGRRLDYWCLIELLKLGVNDKGKAAIEVRISRLKKKIRDAGLAMPTFKAIRKLLSCRYRILVSILCTAGNQPYHRVIFGQYVRLQSDLAGLHARHSSQLVAYGFQQRHYFHDQPRCSSMLTNDRIGNSVVPADTSAASATALASGKVRIQTMQRSAAKPGTCNCST